MAWYHARGCSCSIGCCDCGPTDPNRESALAKEIKVKAEEFTFKVNRKDYSDRRRVVEDVYLHFIQKKEYTKIIDKPTAKKVINRIEKLHEEFKDREGYTPQMLKYNTNRILDALCKFSVAGEKVTKHFEDKFSYITTYTHW